MLLETLPTRLNHSEETGIAVVCVEAADVFEEWRTCDKFTY